MQALDEDIVTKNTILIDQGTQFSQDELILGGAFFPQEGISNKVDDQLFISEWLSHKIKRNHNSHTHNVTFIHGRPGSGKTLLAGSYMLKNQPGTHYIDLVGGDFNDYTRYLTWGDKNPEHLSGQTIIIDEVHWVDPESLHTFVSTAKDIRVNLILIGMSHEDLPESIQGLLTARIGLNEVTEHFNAIKKLGLFGFDD